MKVLLSKMTVPTANPIPSVIKTGFVKGFSAKNIISINSYEDRVLGRLSVEQFQTLSSGYTGEQAKLTEDIPAKETAIQKLRDTVSITEGFITRAKRYTDITELTPELLRLFTQKIVVHEKSTKWSKHALQAIEIHYNGIGCISGDIQQDKESPRQELSA